MRNEEEENWEIFETSDTSCILSTWYLNQLGAINWM